MENPFKFGTIVEEDYFTDNPWNISSISIAKGASSIGVLRDLKGQGKYDGEIEGVTVFRSGHLQLLH